MPKLKYRVSGNHEGARENLGRVTAAAALKKARQFVQEGYIDVSALSLLSNKTIPYSFMNEARPPLAMRPAANSSVYGD
jgi:hypothetical protein